MTNLEQDDLNIRTQTFSNTLRGGPDCGGVALETTAVGTSRDHPRDDSASGGEHSQRGRHTKSSADPRKTGESWRRRSANMVCCGAYLLFSLRTDFPRAGTGPAVVMATTVPVPTPEMSGELERRWKF